MQTEFRVMRQGCGGVWVRRRTKSPEDMLQIDVSDPAQIAHWCREFSCTWLELFAAIEHVGVDIAAIRAVIRN